MKYDVIVIGGGTAGLKASIIAAKSDYATALIEPDDIGGTCLNTGCIPTKTLLHSAHLYEESQRFDRFGLHGDVTYDYQEIMQRMHDIVLTGREQAEKSVKKQDKLDLYKQPAQLTGPHQVRTGDHTIKGKHIVIATGSSPWVPPIDGLEETGYLDNADALQLDEQPEELVMIGGGYISCEFASFYNALGTDVTILERMEHILGPVDDEVSKHSEALLTDQGIDIHTSVDVQKVRGENGEHVEATTTPMDGDGETEHTGDTLFVSTGRRPNTDINLDRAKVEHDHGVTVDDTLQTSQDHIYAIGDVNGKAPFAHTAKREARVALDNALLDKGRTVDHGSIPWAVFTNPPIGGVGMSEADAREDHDVGILKAPYERTGRAKIQHDTEGFVKLVCDKPTEELLGATIIGADAPNLIHEASVLLQTDNPSVHHIKDAVHIHPTLGEVMDEL